MKNDRPRFWDNFPELAALAAQLRDQRIARYPAAIEKGSISPADAATDIAAWTAITADWEHVATLAPRLGPDAPDIDKRNAIAISIQRFEARLRATPDDAQLTDTLAALRALAWHQQRPRLANHLFCAAVTIEARARTSGFSGMTCRG